MLSLKDHPPGRIGDFEPQAHRSGLIALGGSFLTHGQ
jgi:hypothetical protein